MRNHGREFIVGIVFFALLGALGVITVNLGGKAFHPTKEVTFRFEEVAGLTEGAEVWINGLPSGEVKSISLAPDGTVEATAAMRTDLATLDLGGGGTVGVMSKSALGGAVVSVETRKAGGKETLEKMLQTTWQSKKSAFEDAGEKIGEVTGEVKGLLKETREGTGLLAKLIKDPKVAEDFAVMLSNLRQTVEEINTGKGTIGRLVKDETLYRRVDAAVAKLNEVLESADRLVKSAREVVDSVPKDSVARLVKDLQEIVGKVNDGTGTVGKFFNDDSLYRDLTRAASDLSAFTKQVNEGDGLLHQLAYDGDLARDFKGTVHDLQGLFADIRAGKGTVGKLMADDALYADLRDAVRSLQRSFEEARENAPILTFAGFLFKTF